MDSMELNKLPRPLTPTLLQNRISELRSSSGIYLEYRQDKVDLSLLVSWVSSYYDRKLADSFGPTEKRL